MTIFIAAVAGFLVAQTGAGHAQAGLEAEEDINQRILVATVVSKLHRSCGEVSAPFWKARGYIKDTEQMAIDRGYSAAEVKTYIDDDANKDAMRAARNAYFAQNGAPNRDEAALCAVGRKEIADQTEIGSLLRLN